MKFKDILEPEESVGWHWHRLVGHDASYTHYPEAVVHLADIQRVLAVFFRGLGGNQGIQISPLKAQSSAHRLSFRQRLGMDQEKIEQPDLDDERLSLPSGIDLFADKSLNRDLYFWLAAFFARTSPSKPEADLLCNDLVFLRQSWQFSVDTLNLFPGLMPVAARLAVAITAARPVRKLPDAEAGVEMLVLQMLSSLGQPDMPEPNWPALEGLRAPRKYRPFLPVPMWGRAENTAPGLPSGDDDLEEADTDSDNADDQDDRRHKAERREQDQAERQDSFILNRFEKILSMAEMVNLNRDVDDDEEEDAQKVAEELDELTISKNKKKAAAKLRIDLDLPPDAVDVTSVQGPYLYPEWDYRSGIYHSDHCAVFHQVAKEEGEEQIVTPEQTRRIRRTRQQFEALRPKREIFRGRPDGDELDLEALVRSRCDLAASGQGSNRVYLEVRNSQRDLAVALLVDVSLSTDSWISNQRVLDMEKEALTVLSQGLVACGDDHAIYTFTSRRRDFVRVETVKDFDEPPGEVIDRRIAGLTPGYYTRIGAALRHTTKQINDRPNQHRLIILLTDGKPNDVDHYEGRYGIEDTRRAVREARQTGVAVFGVTIDSKAQDYFPHIFGAGAYHIVDDAARLVTALPKIFRQLVS